MDSKQLTTQPTALPFSPENLIAQAIDKALPIDTIEKLLMMRKELKAEFAKEAFDAAMSKFQAECPVIEKNKSGPNNAYRYAPIEEIVRQVKKPLEENGFSYSIQTQMTNDKVKVTCIAKHKLGHSEPSDVELPLATRTGLMNAPQQTAATMTYAKRYAFCNAFGIMTGDEDTDAVEVVPKTSYKATNRPVAESSAPKASVSPADEQKTKIKHLCDELNPALKTAEQYTTFVFNKINLDLTKAELYPMIITRLNTLVEEKKKGIEEIAKAIDGEIIK